MLDENEKKGRKLINIGIVLFIVVLGFQFYIYQVNKVSLNGHELSRIEEKKDSKKDESNQENSLKSNEVERLNELKDGKESKHPLMLIIDTSQFIEEDIAKFKELKKETDIDIIVLDKDNPEHEKFIPGYLKAKDHTIQVYEKDNSLPLKLTSKSNKYNFYLVADSSDSAKDIAMQSHERLKLSEYKELANNLK